MIAFKEFDHIPEWPTLHPKLFTLLRWIDDHWPYEHVIITRLRSDVPHQKTIMHRLGRAADIRVHGMPEWLRHEFILFCNANWDYGDGGAHQCLVYERDPDHFHAQVRDETRLR